VQLVLLIFTTDLVNLGFWIKGRLSKCWDKKSCNSNSRYTRQLSQEDYENVNTGPDAEMEVKYANILVVTYVTMFYGSGIPILYLIAACFFFATFWVDKWMILYYYRKPANFDETLALKTLSWFKFALVLHFIGGILMYSN